MAFNFQGTAAIHKNLSQALIASSSETLVVRMPVARISTGVNPFLGDTSRETVHSGVESSDIQCLWMDAISRLSLQSTNSQGIELAIQAMAGQYQDATSFAEVWLEDILNDTSDPYGTTLLDSAKEVVYRNQRYQVLGYARIGLPITAPYLAVIALKGGKGDNDT